MGNIFTANNGNIPDPIIAEFDRLKYCPEREQRRILNALCENDTIKLEWISEETTNIIICKSNQIIKEFRINKKQPLQN